MYKLYMFNVKQLAKRGAGAVPILWQGVKSWKMLSVGDDDVGSLWPMTSAAGFPPPLSSQWNSAGHIVFVLFQSNLSECGSSGFYLLRLRSVQLCTSGDLLSPKSPWLYFRSPSLHPQPTPIYPPCIWAATENSVAWPFHSAARAEERHAASTAMAGRAMTTVISMQKYWKEDH